MNLRGLTIALVITFEHFLAIFSYQLTNNFLIRKNSISSCKIVKYNSIITEDLLCIHAKTEQSEDDIKPFDRIANAGLAGKISFLLSSESI